MSTGTNFSDGSIRLGGTVDHYLTNDAGDWILIRCTVANLPSAVAGYAVGCLAEVTDSGAGLLYYNSGTRLSATFTAINAGAAALTLATALTDPSTTGAGLAITSSSLTSGYTYKAIGSGTTTLTTGSLFRADLVDGVTGSGLQIVTTGIYSDTTKGLINITATSATTGYGVNISMAGLTSGRALTILGGTALTTGGALAYLDLGAGTAGQGLTIVTTGAYTGTGLATITAGAMTTGVGLSLVSTTGLTSGSLLRGTTSTAGLLATNGAYSFRGTGAYTGTTVGLFDVLASATTAGMVGRFSGTALIGGNVLQLVATAATLTTGRYLTCNDSTTEVFAVGRNGHLISTQTTAPTIATNSTGITAVAVTAASTDTCGTITTTGTPQSGTVLTLTFNATYTTTPKFVIVAPANAAAGGVNTMPIVTQTATTFVLTWPAGGVYAATPSFTYLVVA